VLERPSTTSSSWAGRVTSTIDVHHAHVCRSGPREERLVEPERVHLTDAVVVFEQRCAVRGDRVHHGVPVASELTGDFRDAAAVDP
jgi:hypothetical protein